MKIFICHASEDLRVAQTIALALRGAGIKVFLDETDLPAGGEYHARIRAALASADRFIFLISEHSVAERRFTLNELASAKEKWPHPDGRVFPVIVSPVEMSKVDPYLLAVKLIETKGNIAAAVLEVVLKSKSRNWFGIGALVVGLLAFIAGAIYFAFHEKAQVVAPAPGIERTLLLASGETASIPFSLPAPRVVEVTIKSLKPHWDGFEGERGAPGQDGLYLRICSSVEAPCREGQLGVAEPFSRNMPAGSGHLAVVNFASSPRMSVVVKIKNVTEADSE